MISANVTWWDAFISVGLMMLGGAGGVVVSYFRQRRLDRRNLFKRIETLETQGEVLKQAVAPLSAVFQAALIEKLTHFHTPVMDALLVKLGPPNVLTDIEEIELVEALKQREADMGSQIDEVERISARMLPLVINLTRAEHNLLHFPTSLKIVAVPRNGDIKEMGK